VAVDMSEDLVSIEIDGQPLKAPRGSMLIEAADAAGIYIPRFCYHKKLSVAANCRMCLVEVEKVGKPLPACATPVTEGMKVRTRSPFAREAQRSVMEFLLINHPLDCPICDQGGECELQDLAMGFGGDVSRYREGKRVVKDKDIGPLIATDMTRCIHCTRCVRFGEEIAGVRELGATGRGEHMEIGTFVERTVDSEVSANVIDLCPVGALTSRPFRFAARSWEMTQHPAVSPHDAVGANLYVHVRRGELLRVVPRENEAVNETWIADRDRFSYLGLASEERLLAPMVRREGRWETVGWETALGVAAEGLRAVVAEHGPAALGGLAAPGSTVEELYLLQKLVRGLGSPNVDHRLREGDTSDQGRAPLFPGLGQPIVEVERIQAAVLVGFNLRKEQPLLGLRLRKAALRGARVWAIHPLDHPFSFELAGRMVVGPAGMLAALAGIARAAGAESPDAPVARLIADARPDATQKAAAEALLGAERATVILGDLAMAHPQASLLRGLARALTQRTQAVLGLLPAGGNAAGAWLAGAVPHRRAGGVQVESAGLSAHEMLAGGVKGYLLLGIEPALDCWDGRLAQSALAAARFRVVLASYGPEAWREHADVLLPVGTFVESAGTYVNAEGLWQGFQAAVVPPGEARPAWKVLRVLANYLALPGFAQATAVEVAAEVRAAVEAQQGPELETAWQPPAAGEASALMRIGELPIYAVDPVVRHSSALQATRDAATAVVRVNPGVASRLGLPAGGFARVSQGDGAVTLQVVVDEGVADGCAWVPCGIPATAGLGPAVGPMSLEKA
jgi:NADH-quinone oxidoreductase subunit G